MREHTHNNANNAGESGMWFQSKRLSSECVAGFAGSMISLVLAHPLDTVKTLIQGMDPPVSTASTSNASAKSSSLHRPSSQSLPSRSISAHFQMQQIFRANKGLGLYRGVSVPLLTDGLLSALALGSYKYCQKNLDPSMSHYDVMLGCGLLSGAFTLLPSVPCEVIGTRMQMQAIQSGHWDSVAQTCRKIYQEAGLRGFYRGTLVQALGDLPGSVLYFMSYDITMHRMESHGHSLLHSVVVSAAVAGFMANVFTIPFDVMKTRVQSGVNQTITESFHDLRRYGWRSFIRGWQFVLLIDVFLSPVELSLYEYVLCWIDEKHSRLNMPTS